MRFVLIIVLQITDLLFKYASQEPMNIFKYLMKTTREGISILLEESGGCDTIRTHKFGPRKNKPEKTYGTRKLKPKIDQKIYSHQRLEKEM